MLEAVADFALEHYPLAPVTYYHVGGPARLALFPRTVEEARLAYAWMLKQPGPHLVLGGASNVLISGEGFPGTILFTDKLAGIEELGEGRYWVASGVVLQRLVREIMLPNNYAGVGALTGIPGSVGGAIFMNAGTVNGSTCQWLESVELAGPEGSRTAPITPASYDYRRQQFCAPGELILGGVFRFQPADTDQQVVYEHYMQRRRDTQPQGFCCGSVFKNPPGNHAARLIEACGLKGTRRGGAVISPKHANFIMNEEGATFEDILVLIEMARSRVKEQFGVDLEEEVRIIR